MKKWQQTRSPKEQKVGWRWLTTKWFRDPGGTEQEYVVVGREGSQSVATIALTLDNNVVLSEQFRPGPEKVMQEIPGGGCDEGEELDVAARRELHEETGYTAARVEQLGSIHKSAYSNATSHYFIAYDCVKDGEQHTDDGEFIDIKEVSITELFEIARRGDMTDTEAVFLAYDALKEREK